MSHQKNGGINRKKKEEIQKGFLRYSPIFSINFYPPLQIIKASIFSISIKICLERESKITLKINFYNQNFYLLSGTSFQMHACDKVNIFSIKILANYDGE